MLVENFKSDRAPSSEALSHIVEITVTFGSFATSPVFCPIMQEYIEYFTKNAHDHPLFSLKFVSIEQVSIKTEEFFEQKEGYWQAQLWTYEALWF